MEKSISVEASQRVGYQVCVLPVVPPGNHMRKVQILRLHQQWNFFDFAMDVGFAGPPAFAGQMDDAPQAVRYRDAGAVVQPDGIGDGMVFRAAFDLVLVFARTERQRSEERRVGKEGRSRWSRY